MISLQKKVKIALAVVGFFVFSAIMGILFGKEQAVEAEKENTELRSQQEEAMTLEQYVDSAGSQSVRIANSFGAIRDLTGKVIDDSWFVDLLNETTIIQNACNEAKEMDPPEELKEAHTDYMEGIAIADKVAGKLKEIALSFELSEEGKKTIQNYLAEMEKASLPIRKATSKMKMEMQ